MAAELTRVYKDLRQKYDSLDNQEHFDLLRSLTFFHEFSHAEIWEVLRASDWHEYKDGEDIVREGEVDDRFYIIVAGSVKVEANGHEVGTLKNGECFGETSYVRGAKRQASIRAAGQVTILRVSSTLMEQVSSACQLRFNKVFLRSLINRLQGNGGANT
jgi:CRP-like cAMP-binding protein